MADIDKNPATQLDELAALDPLTRSQVAAWRDTATSPPLTPGHQNNNEYEDKD